VRLAVHCGGLAFKRNEFSGVQPVEHVGELWLGNTLAIGAGFGQER